MPLRVLIARMLLLTWAALYVTYLCGAPDLTGVGVATSTLTGLLAHRIN